MFKIFDKAKRKGLKAEIYLTKGREFPVIFKSNKFYNAEKKQFEGMGIRIIKQGKLGFASTTKIADAEVALDASIDASRFGERARFTLPTSLKVKPVRTFFDSVNKVETNRIKHDCNSIITQIRKEEPESKVDITYSRLEKTLRIANTEGLDITYSKTNVTVYVQIFKIINGSFTWIYKVKSSPDSRFITQKDISELLKNAGLANEEVKLESGQKNVIFMPSVMPIILRSLTLGTNGKNLQKGSSPLKDKLNKRIIDNRITIYDDALLEKGVETRPFDTEGVSSKRIALFKNGVLKNFLFDLQTAGLLGKKSTGSAIRGYNSLPVPGVSNIVVSPGVWSVPDMIKDIKDGIIVHHVLGGGQSNLLSGDFSCNVSLGFAIKNGRILGRVKNTMIAGNVYDMMRNLVGIGKKVPNVGYYYTPAFYLKSVNVVS